MGVFKTLAKVLDSTAGASEKYFLKPLTETFVSPVVREFERPVVSFVRGVQSLAGNEEAGNKPVNTPFGEVKPFANLLDKKSREAPGTLKAGEAAMGAVELATSVPGAAEKILAKGAGLAVKALGPLAKPIEKGVATVGKAVKSSAAKTYGEALAPTTAKLKKATEKVTERALKEGIVGTAGQIAKKAEAGMRKAGQAIEDFGELQGSTAAKKITDVFEAAKQEFRVDGVDINKSAIRTIDELSSTVDELARNTGEVSLEALRAVRRIWDNEVAQAGGFLGKTAKEGSDLAIKKLGSNAIRNLLANEVPDLAKINANFNFYSTLLDVAEATKLRRVGQTGLIKRGIGAGLGAAVGGALKILPFGVGELAGAKIGEKVAQIGGSTLYKSLNAAGKNIVADALLSGKYNTGKIANYFTKSSLPIIKISDFTKFLKKEAALGEEELRQAADEHGKRIQELHDKLFTDSIGVDKKPEFSPEEQQKRLSDISNFLNAP